MKSKLDVTSVQVRRYLWMHAMLCAMVGQVCLIVRRNGGFSFAQPILESGRFLFSDPVVGGYSAQFDVPDSDTDAEAEAKIRTFVAGLPEPKDDFYVGGVGTVTPIT
jgi:hypothetical protein